jgi:hypothetical protein
MDIANAVGAALVAVVRACKLRVQGVIRSWPSRLLDNKTVMIL